jgi:hypothetical protein
VLEKDFIVFDFLKRKKAHATSSASSAMPPLYFKDGEAALQHCCEYMDNPLGADYSLVALVLDARKDFGMANVVFQRGDGIQVALLRVASSDGEFNVVATTSGSKGPRLQPGQLVLWHAGQHIPEVAKQAKDERFGWAGLIVGTLRPEFVNGGWTGGERFSPQSQIGSPQRSPRQFRV